MVQRIFLYFLSEKREGLTFGRLKFASSTTGPSATGCETSRSEMERWTRTPEGTRNESCGRLRKRTPFLRWRAQLDGMLKLWKSLNEC